MVADQHWEILCSESAPQGRIYVPMADTATFVALFRFLCTLADLALCVVLFQRLCPACGRGGGGGGVDGAKKDVSVFLVWW